MTASVLQTNSQISEARASLASRDLVWRTTSFRKLLQRVGLLRTHQDIGDPLKSWDVLQTAEFASKHLKKDEAILDIGAFSSEILIILHRLGFSNLSGIDLNPAVTAMPYANTIQYRIGNFMESPFASGSFALITAISVIEHGYRPNELLKEVARLLRPGGFFVASFDYWPEKISTEGIRIFDMDWRIFSREEVEDLVRVAGSYGLSPQGSLDLAAGERPIRHSDRSYTFAWLALKKSG
ncbi:MAG TPA: class I SAM-dependent methyltransferase [Burkholderiales bacterium]